MSPQMISASKAQASMCEIVVLRKKKGKNINWSSY